jgi:pimeloyl-ACP methyl ester carboxylesterase
MAAAAAATAGDEWADGWTWSEDSLRLHWLERAGTDPARPALLCLPGLTRNARDFLGLFRIIDAGWRIIAVDLRGRGDSGWAKDALSYVPFTYGRDIGRIIAAAGVERFAVIGNSLGGLLALQLTTAHRAAMAGVILNDIGPAVEPGGLARLRANVGRTGNWPTWIHAARDFAVRHRDLYPEWQLADWLAFARRLCCLSPAGRIIFDYDPRIAEPMRLPNFDAGTDYWAALERLAGLPVLSLRAAGSDVLSASTQGQMQRRLPGLQAITVPGVGHAPTLEEPVAAAALRAFLDGLMGRT